MSLFELLGVFPVPETAPVSQVAEKGFPQSLDQAVREPESRAVEPRSRAGRAQQTPNSAPRSDASDTVESDRVTGRRSERSTDERATTDPQVRDSPGVEDAKPLESAVTLQVEPGRPGDDVQNVSEDQVIAEPDIDLTIAVQELVSGDDPQMPPDEVGAEATSAISRASVLDLEGLAQFLDALPVQDRGTDPDLAEIVAQLLVADLEDSSDRDGASSAKQTSSLPDEESSESELAQSGSGLASVNVETSLAGTGVEAPVMAEASLDIVRETVPPVTRAEGTSVLPEVVESEVLPEVVAPEVVVPEVVVPEVVVPESAAQEATVASAETTILTQAVNQQPTVDTETSSPLPSPEALPAVTELATSPDTSSQTSQDGESSMSDAPAQEATKPTSSESQVKVAPQQVTETTPRAVEPVAQARMDQLAPNQAASEVRAPGSSLGESVQRAAQRLVERIEALKNAPPPRTMVLELSELAGARIRVSLNGNTVRMTVMDGSLDSNAREQLDREMNHALAQQGFDLAGNSEQRRERWESAEDSVEEVSSLRQRIRTPRATGLRI